MYAWGGPLLASPWDSPCSQGGSGARWRGGMGGAPSVAFLPRGAQHGLALANIVFPSRATIMFPCYNRDPLATILLC